jgi:mevalonate kinase
MTLATAPGKMILFGEHAAVYGQPAIAVPLANRVATATIEDSAENTTLSLPDLNTTYNLPIADNADDIPLIKAIQLVQETVGLATLPPLRMTVTSDIPIAGGLGSGAATSAALIRALLTHLGAEADDARVCALTYAIEELYHGTPSGIDNTVVSYNRPMWFVKQEPHNLIEPIAVDTPLRLLIADTGIRSATKDVVGDVRRQWLADPALFESLFDKCGRLARQARQALIDGDVLGLGALMTLNHIQLRRMTVSCRELDDLVDEALNAGALGAKLSGAGRGGVMLALIDEDKEEAVREALLETGAVSVWHTDISAEMPAIE